MPGLTLKALHARFAHDLAHAETTLLQEGRLDPLFVVTTETGDIKPLVPDFSDQQSKDMSVMAVRFLAVAENAQMVMHRTEAWLVVGDVPQGISPSQSDRRIEAVLVFLSGRIGTKLHKLSSIREIQRGFDGKPTGLTEVRLPKSGKNSAEMGGPFSELMPKDIPSRENRVIAQVALERFGILKPA